jgi:hypothetical protein
MGIDKDLDGASDILHGLSLVKDNNGMPSEERAHLRRAMRQQDIGYVLILAVVITLAAVIIGQYLLSQGRFTNLTRAIKHNDLAVLE